MDAGRWGSQIWTVAAKTPLIGDSRSPAVLLLGLFGAVFAAYLVWRGRQLPVFPIELAVFALYAGGLALTYATYQRYLEPAVLLCLGLFYARHCWQFSAEPMLDRRDLRSYTSWSARGGSSRIESTVTPPAIPISGGRCASGCALCDRCR